MDNLLPIARFFSIPSLTTAAFSALNIEPSIFADVNAIQLDLLTVPKGTVVSLDLRDGASIFFSTVPMIVL